MTPAAFDCPGVVGKTMLARDLAVLGVLARHVAERLPTRGLLPVRRSDSVAWSGSWSRETEMWSTWVAAGPAGPSACGSQTRPASAPLVPSLGNVQLVLM